MQATKTGCCIYEEKTARRAAGRPAAFVRVPVQRRRGRRRAAAFARERRPPQRRRPPLPPSNPLQNGSRDGEGESAVSDLQKRLQSLNYLDGEADGIFGEDTQAALEAFQALNGLPETGMLDAGTQAALGKRHGRAHAHAGANAACQGRQRRRRCARCRRPCAPTDL